MGVEEGVGVCWFLSVCPSVRLSVFVAPTVLVGSISYLYIVSNNFRRCVSCKVDCKIIFGSFFNIYNFDFVLFWLWDLMWITSMDNHWMAGVSQNAGVLVVLVIPECKCICPQRIHFTPDCLNAHTCTPNVCLYLRNVSATCWLTKDWLLWVSIVYSTFFICFTYLCLSIYDDK